MGKKWIKLHLSLVGRMGFPYGSAGKESASFVWDLGSILGLGRSLGEGVDYPLQYSWASLMAQLVKNLPALCETWVLSLGWEDPLEKGKATHSSILAWRIPWTVYTMGLERFGHDWDTFTFHLTRAYARTMGNTTWEWKGRLGLYCGSSTWDWELLNNYLMLLLLLLSRFSRVWFCVTP